MLFRSYQGRQIDWLIDTGAAVSIISTATWKGLPEGIVRLHSGPRLFGATGQDIRLTGECTLDLRVGNRVLEATVLIGDISMDAILGMDLLSQWGAVINTSTGIVELPELAAKEVDRDTHGEMTSLVSSLAGIHRDSLPRPILEGGGVAVLQHAVTLASYDQQEVMIHCASSDALLRANGPQSLNPDPCVHAHWGVVATPYAKPQAEGIWAVVLTNPGAEECTLSSGTRLGTMRPIEQVPPDETGVAEMEGDEQEDDFPRFLEHRSPLVLPWKEELYKHLDAELDSASRRQLDEILDRNKEAFQRTGGEMGRAAYPHRINTGGCTGIRQRYRRLPPHKRELVESEISRMLELGVLEPSVSSWASPLVLITKKDGKPRFCVDYRQLNTVTVRDAYPLPRIRSEEHTSELQSP